MKKISILFFLIIVLSTLGNRLSAQPGGPANEDPPCWPPPCIPIDGGLSILLAAGLAYGGKKAFDISRMEKNKDEF